MTDAHQGASTAPVRTLALASGAGPSGAAEATLQTPDPTAVSCTLITAPDQLPALGRALRQAVAVAIDTEVPMHEPRRGLLRVMSIAARDRDGHEQAWVIDAREVDPRLLAEHLTGVTAGAWNASFDARVIDLAVWESDRATHGLRWWDGQLADALLHQGRNGFNWYHGLAWATQTYLGLTAQGKGTTQLSYTAFEDLTADQVAYAAADAVETLWVCDRLRDRITEAGLDRICQVEMDARPFLDDMQRVGLPFDAAGWRIELAGMYEQQRTVLGQLALLTGGGQGSLFDDVVEPTWNPGSDRQVRDALNEWSPDQVRSWNARSGRGERLLDQHASVTASVLRDIGGELATALLAHRELTKILTTYGESILDHLSPASQRLHSQYLQVVGTNTGRLASRNPNAQNFSPRMKPYTRPPDPDRVFVHADLSQAELRYLAEVSNDAALRTAFAEGADLHVTTAATMYGFDPDQLRREDPDKLARLRQVAKALNFGIAYGQGASGLAHTLSATGAPTTVAEGKALLDQYRQTYPGTAQWALDREADLGAHAEEVRGIDWPSTLDLGTRYPAVRALSRAFRGANNRWPTADEVAAELHGPAATPPPELVERVAWTLTHSGAVALLADGSPFTFSSRTLLGRRQQFNLAIDSIALQAALMHLRTNDRAAVRLRSRFEREHRVVLHRSGVNYGADDMARVFDDRPLRVAYVEAMRQELGDDMTFAYLTDAARERVLAMINAWKNAPIQGGVADIMLDAYGELHGRLAEFRSAWPVQTVHDSVVIECARSEADAVAQCVRQVLDAALARTCPSIAPRTDVDIRSSLSDSDIESVM